MFFSAFRRVSNLYGSPTADNFVFKLYYRWTTLLLVVFSFIITCRLILLLGNSFGCIMRDKTFPISYINMECYDNTVYILPAKLIKEEDQSTTIDPKLEEHRRYQTYYSWVNLLFLVHAFIFYLPHLLWKSYEKGYMHRLTAGVQKPFDEEDKRGLGLRYLAKYVLLSEGNHRLYTAMYIFFEICNCAISLALTLWLVNFFNVTGVPDYLPYALETWSEFKNFYFPSKASCQFENIGESGLTQRHTIECHLPLNALYMKMFLFLRAWYILLTVLCGLVLVYRIALLVPSFRIFVSKYSYPMSERSVLQTLCHRLSYSDWFFLSTLKKLMIDIDFAQMLEKIANQSEVKGLLKDDEGRFSFYENAAKDCDLTSTSPL